MTDRPSDFDWAPDLGGPERDEVDDWSGCSAAEREEIERLDLEVCGLLPYALDPVEPSDRCKTELLARATGSPAEPATPHRATERPVATFPPPAARPSPRGWMLPLAATLAVVALGLSAGLYGTVRGQRAELEALEGRVQELTRDSVELAAMREGLSYARENLQLVSSQGVEICPLRPMEGAPASDEPYGLLFIAADHQHWYVRVTGLEAGADRYYRLWFEGPDGEMVPAGNLIGEELELSSPTMPKGTRAAYISVETDESPEEPSGEFVLWGNDMIRVL